VNITKFGCKYALKREKIALYCIFNTKIVQNDLKTQEKLLKHFKSSPKHKNYQKKHGGLV
jgi:hypothetical protein